MYLESVSLLAGDKEVARLSRHFDIEQCHEKKSISPFSLGSVSISETQYLPYMAITCEIGLLTGKSQYILACGRRISFFLLSFQCKS